ncbi:hypothetical protein TELCIR_06548 [Teladorsagia circumcincta]|uniref:Uncharacterized protein n=1 Tax=Teladorsagia circumcincta TaxID=45464 RepID=A0A2G9UPB3_TELCI|nr:hypothetical protein TELCIR_06548 [Teladorsagia circumcincta]
MIRSQIRKLRESIGGKLDRRRVRMRQEFAKIGRPGALAVAQLILRDAIAGFKSSVVKKCRRSVRRFQLIGFHAFFRTYVQNRFRGEPSLGCGNKYIANKSVSCEDAERCFRIE